MNRTFGGILFLSLFLIRPPLLLFSQSTPPANVIQEWILSSLFMQETDKQYSEKNKPASSFILKPSLLRSLLSLFSSKKHPDKAIQKRFENAFISTYQPFFTFINTHDTHTPLSFLSHYKTEVTALQERIRMLEKEISSHSFSTQKIITQVNKHLLKKIKAVELQIDPSWKAFFYRHLYTFGSIATASVIGAALFYLKNPSLFSPLLGKKKSGKQQIILTEQNQQVASNSSNPHIVLEALQTAASKGDEKLLAELFHQIPSHLKLMTIEKSLGKAAAGGHRKLLDKLIAWHEKHHGILCPGHTMDIITEAAKNGHHKLTLDLLTRYPEHPFTLQYALKNAAEGGHRELLENLITWHEKHYSSLSTEAQTNAMKWAAKNGHHKLTFQLLKHHNNNPLLLQKALEKASKGGHKELLENLITWHEKHYSSFSTEAQINTMKWAAKNGHHKLTFQILKHHNNNPLLLQKALEKASKGGIKSLVEILLDKEREYASHITEDMIKKAIIKILPLRIEGRTKQWAPRLPTKLKKEKTARSKGHEDTLITLISFYEKNGPPINLAAHNEREEYIRGYDDRDVRMCLRYTQCSFCDLFTVLNYAVESKKPILLQALLDEKRPVGKQVTKEMVEKALKIAAQGDCKHIFNILISTYEKRYETLSQETQYTLIKETSAYGRTQLTYYLLQRYPNTLPFVLEMSAAYGDCVMIKILLYDETKQFFKKITKEMIEKTLHTTAQRGQQKPFEILRNWYHKKNYIMTEEMQKTMVRAAARNQRFQFTFYLLSLYPHQWEAAIEGAEEYSKSNKDLGRFSLLIALRNKYAKK